MGLTREQLAVLHVARRDLALSEDEYRDLLHCYAGVRSAKDLDGHGFVAVMQRFEALGFKGWQGGKGRRRPAGAPAPAALVTKAQQGYIADLAERIGLAPHQLRALSQRACGLPWPQTRRDASTLLLALRNMDRTGWKPTQGHASAVGEGASNGGDPVPVL